MEPRAGRRRGRRAHLIGVKFKRETRYARGLVEPVGARAAGQPVETALAARPASLAADLGAVGARRPLMGAIKPVRRPRPGAQLRAPAERRDASGRVARAGSGAQPFRRARLSGRLAEMRAGHTRRRQ